MNFREVRKKIKTIGNVKKITNAMQMVSAVKMRKAQQVALTGRPYRAVLTNMIARIVQAPGSNESSNILISGLPTKNGKNLYIVVSSNKGLAGSFHYGLLKHLYTNVDLDKSSFIVIGKKATDFLGSIGGNILADFSSSISFADDASSMFTLAKKEFEAGNVEKVYVVYNSFVSSFTSAPVIKLLLPVSQIDINLLEKTDNTNYSIEPSSEEVLGPLLNDFLTEEVRSAVLDSQASEHSARMLAMKNATDSATDIITNLTLLRNRIRQSSITGELLDMIGASQSSS